MYIQNLFDVYTYIITCIYFIMTMYIQVINLGTIKLVIVYTKKGTFPKECPLACQKTYYYESITYRS